MKTSTPFSPFRHVAPDIAASLARWWSLETLLATLVPRAARAEPVRGSAVGVLVLPFQATALRPA
ncbi:MAG: hypothetical protein SFW67_16630 [Myxococcaceae bacterium]|nr:hypothetical protein [Myxococcaceae bacterium]